MHKFQKHSWKNPHHEFRSPFKTNSTLISGSRTGILAPGYPQVKKAYDTILLTEISLVELIDWVAEFVAQKLREKHEIQLCEKNM